MEIDTKKLSEMIRKEVKDVVHGIYSSGTRVLINGPGYQVQLLTTCDEDDFVEDPNVEDLKIINTL